jgi:hypothetical protein
MAYALHIERPDDQEPISLEEWKAAVNATKGIRLSQAKELTITNPKTQEVITIPVRDGDVETYFPKEQAWLLAIRWSEGFASMNARFEPGDMSHPVWAAAAALASRLKAVIRGDGGEHYELQTGQLMRDAPVVSQPISDDVIKFKEAMTSLFKPESVRVEPALLAIRDILAKYALPLSGYGNYGKSISFEDLQRAMRRIPKNDFEIDGHGFQFWLLTIARSDLDRFEVRSKLPPDGFWNAWASQLFGNKDFVLARIFDEEFDEWQNREDIGAYEAAGKPHEHLPNTVSDLPAPLNRSIIDISRNPGRSIWRDGFIEAVGSTMWLGDPFWELTRADPKKVANTPWLKVSKPFPNVLRIQAADRCFTSAEGESGEIQNKLRALLFPKSAS